jgi:hypothetical protein
VGKSRENPGRGGSRSLKKPKTPKPPTEPPRERLMGLVLKKGSSKKGRKPLWAFKAPDDVDEYLRSMVVPGFSRSDVLIELVRVVRDLERELGDASAAIEEMARKEGTSTGLIVGQLARRGLDPKIPRRK